MLKKVCITGGAGFLGVHLTRYLLRKGYQVTIIDIAKLDAQDLKGKVTEVNADIRNRKSLEKAVKGSEFVVHAAAALPIQRTKEKIFGVNVNGTKRVLEASKKLGVKRVVFISTTAVYGVPKHLPEKEDSPLDPIGYYGQSKLEAENLCFEYCKKGLEVTVIRPKSFLGPERLGVFELWFEAIYSSYRVFILGEGNNLYQLLSVYDVTTAIEKALTSKRSCDVFNIGAQEFGTWRQDLGFVVKKYHSKSKITSLPTLPSQAILWVLESLNLSPLSAWHYKTMPIPSYVSIEKAKKELGWKPTQSNRQLLSESYEWYKKNRSKVINKVGKTHRVGWNFKILNLVSRI